MFIKNSFANEIISSFETNLQNFGQKEKFDKNAEAIQNLLQAASLFEEAGLISQANDVTSILEGLVSKAWELTSPEEGNELKDLKDLSSKDMEDNLKEKGWVFNADDDLVVEEDEYPDDYETCGTCGYDHAYDLLDPETERNMIKAHIEAGELVESELDEVMKRWEELGGGDLDRSKLKAHKNEEKEKLMEKIFRPEAKQQAKKWQDEDKKRLGLEWWNELGKDKDLPDDYEACEICGYDHKYDITNPEDAKEILKIHQGRKDEEAE